MYVLIVKLIAINWVQSHVQEENGCFITLANLFFYKLPALKQILAISRPVASGGLMGASAPPFLKLENFISLPTSAGVFTIQDLPVNLSFARGFHAWGAIFSVL